MHEYSLAQSLLSALLEHLAAYPAPGRVVKVHVKKGELLILSEWALKEAWRILSEGTELSGAELVLENVPVQARCDSCGYAGNVRYLMEEGWHVSVPILACPRCGGKLRIVEGRELAIVGLTVEEAKPV
ncbi:MAG: hydrogenase maturation nickel metallochaperone HypA/HybF [Candidatus Bipolaricaulaceae bacterium]